MTFEDLKFRAHPSGPMFGERARVNFPNGYGASVIRGPYSYGGSEGKYELAVMKGDKLCYDTPITSDVCGYLNISEVTELLQKIEALPPAVKSGQRCDYCGAKLTADLNCPNCGALN